MMRTILERTLFAGAACATLAAVGSAQAINLDVGDTFTFGSPSAAYGAGSGQAGVWNNASSSSGFYSTSGLLDINGNATTAGTSAVAAGNGLGDFVFDHPATSGDDEALMDDLQDIGSGTSETTWTWTGLANGPYDVYVYAWAPDSATYITGIEDPTTGATIIVGPSDWPGSQVRNQTYGLFCVNVLNGTFSVKVHAVAGGGFASINGWQLVPSSGCGEPGQTFCDADGVNSTPCPCGNNNDGSAGVAAGCRNSNNAAGGVLRAVGTASIGAADLEFQGSNLEGNSPGLYFQGDSQLNGGLGNAFGDGLRCAGINVVRVQTVFADAAGGSNTSVNVAATGGVSAGETKHYQLWYRNPSTTLCGSNFNLTNGYTVTWAP